MIDFHYSIIEVDSLLLTLYVLCQSFGEWFDEILLLLSFVSYKWSNFSTDF